LKIISLKNPLQIGLCNKAPVHYQCISQLCDPALTIDDITTSRTTCIHLYNEMLKGIKLEELDDRTIMSRLLKCDI
ncbi:galactosyltransferase Lgt5, partial [Acinetobacter baumannii]